MNKVFNWIFSGFFRTIGRIFVYIILALLLSYILKDTDFSNFIFMNVNAEWYDNIQYYPSNVSMYNCTSSGCSSVSVTPQDLYIDNNVRGSWEMFTSTNPLTIGSNGIVISNYLQTNLYAGYLYLIQTYFCTSYTGTYNTYSANLNLGWNYSQTATTEQIGTTFHTSNIGTTSDAIAGNTCYIVNSLVVPSGTKQIAGLHLYRTSGSVNTTISLVGFSIQNVGLYDAVTNESIASAISNSGFATASSVQDVQDSVDEVQRQLDETNNAIDEQTQQQHNDQMVCSQIDKNNGIVNRYLKADGTLSDNLNSNYTTSDFINIFNSEVTALTGGANTDRTCFYNVNKSLISCLEQVNVGKITLPANSYYMRATIKTSDNRPTFQICKNGNQSMNDNITNPDSSGSQSEAENFFSNFSTNTHGLTGIITAPLFAIQSLTSQTCEPLVLPLPFINENLTLPCMRSIYVQYFGDFMTLYDIITLGIISYWVMVRIFGLVKDFKNPEHDEIEVVDL